MKRAMFVVLGAGAVIFGAAAIGTGATAGGEPQSLSRDEYETALRTIAASRESATARCEALSGHAHELCRIEADANEMVRAAQAEASFRRTRHAARALQRAQIDFRYQVDRVKCGALGGFKRDKCSIQAHATKGRAMLAAAAPYEVRSQP